MSDEMEPRRKRLRMAAGRRGFLEVELAMRPFLERELAGLNENELDQLETLARLEDLDLWAVISQAAPPPPGVEPTLVARIRAAALRR
ncbi:protein of unknown function DUF339 [Desulfarculus baarsii DSM 2075]|uniref:FAD assembly factor SdhE n=1 Tax=Desulfarculus baarsii (strain ATCC 33931 / DSM 2075 / LMG 7858 / VKM B-1802 / 2st14) TaxID=644282 RepID=E1QIN2_DESB2|nr:succinate dehydrogenase assembly factor 2 [Desulfarculus baarsii]ADK84455.1 protein of unknown function DUF339 [Desulfarculus baarsii DSM 2075]